MFNRPKGQGIKPLTRYARNNNLHCYPHELNLKFLSLSVRSDIFSNHNIEKKLLREFDANSVGDADELFFGRVNKNTLIFYHKNKNYEDVKNFVETNTSIYSHRNCLVDYD
ncbi:hypothetical protein K9L67_02815 [Candidatus Woesearchaeota archaeon]|nr:hypothetical protein [Candidatus Woesearchaeota archaeon]MCF7901134.1 hypothetical protein [Candidatus Woesearchaeota archaeon]MCF8013689.1 hypothetical protein [Candidatus Woesearchaeota archaeon]